MWIARVEHPPDPRETMSRGGTLPSLNNLSTLVAAAKVDPAKTAPKLEKFYNQAPESRKGLERAKVGTLSEMNTCLYWAHQMCDLFTEDKPSRVEYWENRLLSLLGSREKAFYVKIEETRTSLMPHHPLLNLFWLICVFALYPDAEIYQKTHNTKGAEAYARKKRKQGDDEEDMYGIPKELREKEAFRADEPYYGRYLHFAHFEIPYYHKDDYDGGDPKTMFWDYWARIDTIPQVASPYRTLEFMEEIRDGKRMAPPPAGGPVPAGIVVMVGGVRKLRLPTNLEVDWASYAVRMRSGADRKEGSSSFQ